MAGAGRIGQALGRLLRERGEAVTAVASRRHERAESAALFLGGGVRAVSYADLPKHASRILIAVSDDAVSEVARILAGAGMQRGLVLHTSGSRGPEALSPLAEAGVACGVLHPLQTVASPEQGLPALLGIAFAVAGDDPATAWAEHIVSLLDGRALRIAPGSQPVYHAAAVVASNYVVGLIDAAITLMKEAGVEEERARDALGPLVRASVDNALTMGPARALTGPIARGDVATVSSHLDALAAVSPPLRELYRVLGVHVLELARGRGLPPAAGQSLGELLRDPEKRDD
jgi:predicted short-subunit dehydrogenase-like oxidoreductase (DUF2520 family)